MGTTIYTIGHSNHEIEHFLKMLARYGIELLVDVRSDPYSRYAPQFSKHNLQRAIEAAGVQYRCSGAYIGGKPRDCSLYTPSGKPDFDRIAATAEFQNELKLIVKMASTKLVALMCSEADPSACHRGRILTPVLAGMGVDVLHIMPDGALGKEEQTSLF